MNQQQTLFSNLMCMFLRVFSYELSIQFSKCVQFSRRTHCSCGLLQHYLKAYTSISFDSFSASKHFFISPSTGNTSRCTLADDDFRQVNKRLTSFVFSALSLVLSIEIDYVLQYRFTSICCNALKRMCLSACSFRWLTLNWHQ